MAVFAQEDFLEGLLKKSALTSKSKYDSTWPHVYHDAECLIFLTFFIHSLCILHACYFFQFKMMLYDFLAISI